jgi:hypothetical protein
MSQIAKHYELARHHKLAGLSYDADLPDGVRNGLNHEAELGLLRPTREYCG